MNQATSAVVGGGGSIVSQATSAVVGGGASVVSAASSGVVGGGGSIVSAASSGVVGNGQSATSAVGSATSAVGSESPHSELSGLDAPLIYRRRFNFERRYARIRPVRGGRSRRHYRSCWCPCWCRTCSCLKRLQTPAALVEREDEGPYRKDWCFSVLYPYTHIKCIVMPRDSSSLLQ